MTRDEAIALMDTKWWVGKSAREIAAFQLHEDRLCMPFSEFQKAMKGALGRPVWTHEFADRAALQTEFDGGESPAGPLESLARVMMESGSKAEIVTVEVPERGDL